MYIGWIKVKGLAFAEDVDGILQVCRSVVVEDDMTWHARVDNYTEVVDIVLLDGHCTIV